MYSNAQSRVHIKCSGITKRMVADSIYVCCRCKARLARPIDDWTVTEVDVDGTMLDVETPFCYLGEMLCSKGDCDSAIAARCCVALLKFQETLACPNHQTPLTYDTRTGIQKGVRGLYSIGYAPWLQNVGTK